MEHEALTETIDRLIKSGLDEWQAITLVAALLDEFIPEDELLEIITKQGRERLWS